MKPMCIGEEKDGLFKLGDYIVHLELLYVWLEVRQVVDSALAMGSCDDVSGILTELAYILCDFAPRCFQLMKGAS